MINKYNIKKEIFPYILFALVFSILLISLLTLKNYAAEEEEEVQYNWEATSVGGGGTTYSPTINPDDDNMLLIHCDMCGNYLSYDGGNSFKFQTVANWMHVSHIPSENVIYMGGNSVWKSVDKGKSFKQIFPKEELITAISHRGPAREVYYEHTDNYGYYHKVEDITTSKLNENSLFVVSYNHYYNKTMVYYSNNAGESFEVIYEFSNYNFQRLYADENVEEIVYLFHDNGIKKINVLTKEVEDVYQGSIIEGTANHGQFYIIKEVSDDNNFLTHVYKLDSNFQIEKNMTQDLTEGIWYNKRNFTTIETSNDGTMVVGFGSNWECIGVAKTKDDGVTWEVFNEYRNFPTSFNLENMGYLQRNLHHGDDPLGLAISETNSDIILYTTYYSDYLTKDGGKTWRQLESIYDEDEQSTRSTGMDNTVLNSLAIDPNNKNNMIMGAMDVGSFISNNGGETWKKGNTGLIREWENSYGSIYIPEQKDLVFTIWSRQNDIIFKKLNLDAINQRPGGVTISYDGGITPIPIKNVFPENTSPVDIRYLYDKEVNGYSIYICFYGHGVYKSSDLGATWKKINNGLDQSNLFAYSITNDKENNLYLTIANTEQNTGGLYWSKDGGVTWQGIPVPNANNKVATSIAFDKNNTMYASFLATNENNFEFPYSWNGGGVYKSDDLGLTWQTVLDDTYSLSELYYDEKSDRLFISGFYMDITYYQDNSIHTIDGFDLKCSNGIVVDDDILYVLSMGIGLYKGTPTEKENNTPTIENTTNGNTSTPTNHTIPITTTSPTITTTTTTTITTTPNNTNTPANLNTINTSTTPSISNNGTSTNGNNGGKSNINTSKTSSIKNSVTNSSFAKTIPQTGLKTYVPYIIVFLIIIVMALFVYMRYRN